MEGFARCTYCGEWADRGQSVSVVVEVHHRRNLAHRMESVLHNGACLDSWAVTSRSLVADVRRLVPVL